MFQLSLRSLLLLVALVALAIVSFRHATQGWVVAISALSLLTLLIAVIIAVVDRGSRRAFAIGLSSTMLVYLTLIFLLVPYRQPFRSNPELNPGSGRFITSRMLSQLYSRVVKISWVDIETGTIPSKYDPRKAAQLSLSEIPTRMTFMAIGHCWWAMLLGLCGGWIARSAYLRRVRESDSLASGRG